ncbi:hypothetical protein B0H16DRAFT_1503014 [Mycena metata]|uniref:S5 DRBM domain-containing protein n=1 Tax=Mycena metata TaxID=1033252 RepID=A0AAD7K7B7_9AGAR|nr:hypothetical protein B0H16DRAFT_1503014 [Mycena metata]
MNRLVRLVARRPIVFAIRRTPLLRRYSSLKPSPESLYAQYINLVKKTTPNGRPPLTLEEFTREMEEGEDDVEGQYAEYVAWAEHNSDRPPMSFEEFARGIEDENDAELYADFEGENGRFQEVFGEEALPQNSDASEPSELPTTPPILTALEEMEANDPNFPEGLKGLGKSVREEMEEQGDEAHKPPFLDRYDNILAALEEMEATDPNFPETLKGLEQSVSREMEERGDPLFRERLANLNPETRSEQDVAERVAQLILSTTDKWELEQIEDSLATYKGPLSRLNVGLEWYLNNPEQITLSDDPASSDDEDSSSYPLEESSGENYGYYYLDTPFDELAAHLRNRDVQYIIKNGMDYQDRKELFALLDKLVVPVFNEDMDVLHDIAAIFAKYDEDVHLEFHTQPRLPRIRRLDVFKRLLPKPDDDTPVTLEKENSEIAEILNETKQELEIVQAEARAKRQKWPNLMTRDPLLDSRDVLDIPPTKDSPFQNRVVIRNHHSIFTEALHADSFDFSKYEPTKTDDVEETGTAIGDNLPISAGQVARLQTYPIMFRNASQQTGKGKIARIVRITIVGDGHGMVGLGFGKHSTAETAGTKAFRDAVRNMDWVERFEDRTIWTEVQTKFGATVVILRPRPVGFGLRCNPYIHHLLAAAGIKDISAKVWGSRNPIGVLKATLRLLHAGNAPLGMGDGVGGPGRKSWKGTGLRNKNQIERERGRRLIDLRV